MSTLENVFGLGRSGTSISEPQASWFYEGQVIDVTEAGMTFTLPRYFDPLRRFGPAPWTMVGTPTMGDRCLVIFVGPSISNPWVIGWWAV